MMGTARPTWAQTTPTGGDTHGGTRGDDTTPADISTVDAGEFAAQLAASRRVDDLTAAQVRAIREVLGRALRQGLDARMLDPTAPRHERRQALAAVLRPAIEQGDIPGLSLPDDTTVAQIDTAVLGWGPQIQPWLDDPHITEVKITGQWASAEGTHGRQIMRQPYPSVDVPRARVKALAQLLGVTLDDSHPSDTLALPHKTRLHVTLPPLVPHDEVQIVIRRGRRQPWTMATLVEHQSLSAEAATLLRGLMQAWPTALISGAQNSGKTTFLECVLNELPDDTHLLLLEDHTDEVRLQSQTVTRLQRLERTADGSAGVRQIKREVLRMTPDYVVPVEVRNADDAGPALELAWIGRPLLTTLHADTPRAAVQRCAALAAATNRADNPFAGREDLALRTLTTEVDLVVHLVWSRRLWRRLVASVHLSAGPDATGQPQLIPLIEAQLPTDGTTDVTWACHARLQGQRLVWDTGADQTPARLAHRLADVPPTTGTNSTTRSPMATVQDIPQLLDEVRQALPYADQGPDMMQRLQRAYALDPDDVTVWQLAERVLQSHAGVPQLAAQAAATHMQIVQEALDARQLAAVQTAIDQVPRDLWLRQVLGSDRRWQQVVDQAATLQALVDQAQASLERAHHRHVAGDHWGAYQQLVEVAEAQLPTDLVPEVWQAQQAVLQVVVQQADLDAPTRAACQAHLTRVTQQLARVTPPLDRREGAVVDPPEGGALVDGDRGEVGDPPHVTPVATAADRGATPAVEQGPLTADGAWPSPAPNETAEAPPRAAPQVSDAPMAAESPPESVDTFADLTLPAADGAKTPITETDAAAAATSFADLTLPAADLPAPTDTPTETVTDTTTDAFADLTLDDFPFDGSAASEVGMPNVLTQLADWVPPPKKPEDDHAT